MSETTRQSEKSSLGPGPAVAAVPARLGYHPALDGVRGLGILSVMAIHTGYGVFLSGHYSVDVFFVLSGFLITMLLLQEQAGAGRVSLRLFWGRRAARLLPALVAVCSVVVVSVVDVVVSVRPVLNPTSIETALVGVAVAIGYLARGRTR